MVSNVMSRSHRDRFADCSLGSAAALCGSASY
jgi:hypothetical protein